MREKEESHLKLQLDELHIQYKCILNSYSKNKRELLGEITPALQPQNNSVCLQTICLLIIQLLSPNMLNHFKGKAHEMSFQFILSVLSWQSEERIIGLSGLTIYKTRQKHKNLFFKCLTDVMILMGCIVLFVILRNGLCFWKLTWLIRFHPVSLDFAAKYNHFYLMKSRIQASASLL